MKILAILNDMSFFDEAIIDLLKINPDLETFSSSDIFLKELDHCVKLIMIEINYQLWTQSICNKILSMIQSFLEHYSMNNVGFEYKLDTERFFKTKDLYIDFRNMKYENYRTVMFTVNT